jgi:hypothetical protein
MAKGEGFGLFVPEGIDSEDPREIAAWAYREHMRISAALEAALVRQVEFLNVEPVRLREGMIRGADGTNWNPGAGKGVYAYYSGAWNKLG